MALSIQRRKPPTTDNITTLCILIIFAHLVGLFETYAGTVEDLSKLDKLLKTGYDRRATPTNHLNNTPTTVYCELFVRSFGSPSPLTMDYKVDLYLRQTWLDERLKHENITRAMDLNDPNLVKAIWKPEVYFPNGKEADFQFVTVPNVLVRIHPDGTILYMLRLKVTFSCMMDLSKFPLDRQTCTMEVASFSKTVEELILLWKEKDPIVAANHEMTQFEMAEIVATKCHESFQIGNYSCLVAEFHLVRLLGFHLVQSYLPTILMVVISWVAFWMDVNAVPGRVTLGITTLLTVSSKATNVQENIESSYVKAIDVWMGACTAFVFMALMEFTVVNYLWRMDVHLGCAKAKAQQRNSSDGGSASGGIGGGGPSISRHGSSDAISRRAAHSEGAVVGIGEDNVRPRSGSGSPTSNTLVQIKEKIGGSTGNHLEARFIENPNHQYMTVSESHLRLSQANIQHSHSLHLHNQPSTDAASDEFQGKAEQARNYQRTAKKIDEASRVVFPIAFTIFVICYWVYYKTV